MGSNSNQAGTGLGGRQAEDLMNKTPGILCFREHCSALMDSFVLFMGSIRTERRAFCFLSSTCVYSAVPATLSSAPHRFNSQAAQQPGSPQHRDCNDRVSVMITLFFPHTYLLANVKGSDELNVSECLECTKTSEPGWTGEAKMCSSTASFSPHTFWNKYCVCAMPGFGHAPFVWYSRVPFRCDRLHSEGLAYFGEFKPQNFCQVWTNLGTKITWLISGNGRRCLVCFVCACPSTQIPTATPSSFSLYTVWRRYDAGSLQLRVPYPAFKE